MHDHVSQKRGIQNSKNSAEKSIDPEVARQAFERRHECYRVAIDSLNHVFEIVGKENAVYPEKFMRTVEQMWRFSIESKDELWHYALYDYLNDNNEQRSRLGRLDTNFIQNWFDYSALKMLKF